MTSLQTPPLSAEPAAPGSHALRLVRILLPIVVLAAGIALWELVVRLNNIPPYVLPAPVAVFRTLIADWPVLSQSLATTLVTTFEGFVAAAIGGVALALLFNQSKWLEYSLFPYAVILQVTPVIAIAPLLLIYLPQQTAVVVCAWIVGFFPVLSNTTLGLNSVDRNLAGLFQLYGASRMQTLRYLKLPSALPFMLGGLRIAWSPRSRRAPPVRVPDWPIELRNPAIVSTFPECSRRCCCSPPPGLSSMGCWR